MSIWCKKEENNERKYKFEKLTPYSDGNIDVYDSAIDYVFEDSDVRNVAISGAYGAGKSSVLASYKKKNPEKKFVHISLAHFRNQDEDDPSSIKESILEGKILNQLIHQIPAERIPQTNFRVKHGISIIGVFGISLGIASFLLALLHIINFSVWSDYVHTLPKGWLFTILEVTTNEYAPLVTGIMCFALAFAFVFSIVKAQKSKIIFKRLNLQGNEIEIFEQTDDSYFDKYLNEVLYLFENIDADVVVFEDMDRFEANSIFERLHEVNTLVNQNRKKNRKSVLRFFYLLRDDIFISKDRTKFFDYIIPIVPIVDGTNSYDQFITHLKKNGLFEKLDESFLQGVSLYVDDMRLLKNICNEFLIYHSRLNIIDLNYNKMLAIIIYKNLFPRDFCDLQLGKGFVHSLFAHKSNFIETECIAIEQQIKEFEERIAAAQNEHLTNLQELKMIYDAKRSRYYDYLSNVDQRAYDKRKQAIEDSSESVKVDLRTQIDGLRQKKLKLVSLPLAETITRENVDSVFSISDTNEIGALTTYNEIKSSDYFPLLKYLIRNGYIDETYADYMTYFYENSLSRVDKVFLRSVTDKKAKGPEYLINNPQMVFSRLRMVDFDQEETLNYSLLNYILDSVPDSEALARLIGQLRKNKNLAFIVGFYDIAHKKGELVAKLNSLWPELFISLLSAGIMQSDRIKEYSVLTLCCSEDAEIEAVNIEGKLTEYIAHSSDYLRTESPQTDKLISGFKLLGVSFTQLNYDISNKALLSKVYSEGLYDLTFENIALMLHSQFGIESHDEVSHRNASNVLANADTPLYTKVMENLQAYLDLILTNCGGIIGDDKETVQMILNSDKVDNAQKEQYINYLITPIVALNGITKKDIWAKLIQSPALNVTEENIMEYFLYTQKMGAELITFINRSSLELNCARLCPKYSDTDREKLFDAIIPCSALQNLQYRQLVTSLDFSYDDSFTVLNVPEDKVTILIDTEIVQMGEKTLQFMRKNYQNVLYHYISVNLTDYVELVKGKLFVHEESLKILDWDVDDSVKLQLLEVSRNPITIIGKQYTLPVQIYILQNNLNEEDMPALYSDYHMQDEAVQSIVLEYAINNIDTVIEVACTVSELLINQLLSEINIAQVDKTKLIVELLPECGQEQAGKLLSLGGLEEYNKIFDTRTRPRYEIDDCSTLLLEAFQQKKWIFEFLEDEEKPGHYKIRRTPQRNRGTTEFALIP